MRSPFKNISKAFEVFFDSRIIAIITKSSLGSISKKISVNCCVMEDVTATSIMEESMDTTERYFNIVLENDCESLKLQRGDKVKTCDGKIYNVMSVVEDEIFGKVIKTRLGK